MGKGGGAQEKDSGETVTEQQFLMSLSVRLTTKWEVIHFVDQEHQ